MTKLLFWNTVLPYKYSLLKKILCSHKTSCNFWTVITCRKSFPTIATYGNTACYIHAESRAAGSGKDVRRSQGWFDTSVVVSQVVNLSWQFPLEVHKQVQPDKNDSPLTCARKIAFLTPFSCNCLKSGYPRHWEHTGLFLTFSKRSFAQRRYHREK